MPDTYTPADVAKLLDTSPATVRRMCGYFASHLSPAAAPQKGQERLLSPEDVHILQAARLAMNEGKTVEQVNAALSHFTLPPEFRVPELPTVTPTTPDTFVLSQRIIATLETLTGYQETFTALATRLDTLTAAQEADTVARREQTAALQEMFVQQQLVKEKEITALTRLAAAQEAEAAAQDRLINAAHLVFTGILAISIIVLLTLAVAIGWIG
jgi:DNA-binding transcriptional MerR regulator